MQRVPGSILGRGQNLFPLLLTYLLHVTWGASEVDNKDLIVGSNQGNVWLFTPHPGHHGREVLYTEYLPKLNEKFKKIKIKYGVICMQKYVRKCTIINISVFSIMIQKPILLSHHHYHDNSYWKNRRWSPISVLLKSTQKRVNHLHQIRAHQFSLEVRHRMVKNQDNPVGIEINMNTNCMFPGWYFRDVLCCCFEHFLAWYLQAVQNQWVRHCLYLLAYCSHRCAGWIINSQ